MEGWVLKEALLVILALALLVSFLIPKYVVITKKAVAQEALKTMRLMTDVVNEYYICNGNFTADLEDMNLSGINGIETIRFQYSLSGISISDYKISAYGQEGSAAEVMMVLL